MKRGKGNWTEHNPRACGLLITFLEETVGRERRGKDDLHCELQDVDCGLEPIRVETVVPSTRQITPFNSGY